MSEKDINEIEVVDAEILTEKKEPSNCYRADRVCDPEGMFEMIETCKICGRCV